MKTKEEISLVRANAGRLGGMAKRGTGHGRAETVPMRVRKADYEAIAKVSDVGGMPMAEVVHRMVERMKGMNKKLFGE